MIYIHHPDMFEPLPQNPVAPSENPLPQLLEDVFFAPLREVMADGVKTRSCKALEDEAFVALNVLRVPQCSKSGRDFIQSHGIPNLSCLSNLGDRQNVRFFACVVVGGSQGVGRHETGAMVGTMEGFGGAAGDLPLHHAGGGAAVGVRAG